MTRHLGALTMKAFACPTAGILSNGWPDHLRTQGLTRSLNSWVAEPVDDVKDLLSKGEGDIGTGRAVADVHDQRRLSYVDRFEI